MLTTTSSRAAVEACLTAMDRLDPTLAAVITRVDDRARARADHLDILAATGESAGPLHGVTLALKDNIDTAGVRTTAGSLFFANRVPDTDAPVAAALNEAGAILTAKVNLAEFALGATTQNQHYGSCRNAWDPLRIPGGSSGGSAVAVAAGMAQVALGTDTGGSVRIPAAVNGLVGLRPTRGRISNRGVTPLSEHFDSVGPIARTAAEVAAVFEVIDSFDRDDPTARSGPRRGVLDRINDDPAGLRVGIPRAFFFDDLDAGVAVRLEEFASTLRDLGCTLVDLDLADAAHAQGHMFHIVYPDAAAFHAERMRTAPEVFGTEVLARLRLGEGVDARDMARALAWRRRWQVRVERCLTDVDLIVTPTLASDVPLVDSGDMITTTHRITRFSYAWAMYSGPSLSLPCGLHPESGLPVGAHLTAAPWAEDVALRLAHAYQQVTDHHLATSPLVASTLTGGLGAEKPEGAHDARGSNPER